MIRPSLVIRPTTAVHPDGSLKKLGSGVRPLRRLSAFSRSTHPPADPRPSSGTSPLAPPRSRRSLPVSLQSPGRRHARTVRIQLEQPLVQRRARELCDSRAAVSVKHAEQRIAIDAGRVIGHCRSGRLLRDFLLGRDGWGLSGEGHEQVHRVRVFHAWCEPKRFVQRKADSLIRHPCMSDRPTQYCLSRSTTVVCFSVTV